MTTFKKKPVSIEAFQMTKERRYDNSEWPNWLHQAWQREPSEGALWCEDGGEQLYCGTLEGVHIVTFDDYIIQGVQGELYPCKPDIFHATYTIPHDDPAVNKIYDHIDDFAQSMKDKMTDTYHEGREGWDNPENMGNIEKLLQNAAGRLFDGNTEQAVDVANLAMMLHFFEPTNRVS